MNIYKNFCSESFAPDGSLSSFRLKYPENFNFGYDVVDEYARLEPDKRAMVWCDTEGNERIFTFGELSLLSNKAANVLKDHGIGRGDRVILALKRHYEYWITIVALHKIGAVAVPVTHMLTAKDYVYRINCADIKAFICTDQGDVRERALDAVKQTGADCRLWSIRTVIDGFMNFSEQLEAASDKFERIETGVHDPMLLYFTSGTTGMPKGVIHDHTYALAHIVTAKYWHHAIDGGLHFTVAETGWGKASWGKIYGQWLVGSAVMVFDFDNFDPKQLMTVIKKYSVNTFCAPPTIYRYLVRSGIPELPSLSYATTAGELLNPEVFRKFKEITGLTLCEGYGQTETTLLTANFSPETSIAGSMGVSSPQYDVRLLKTDGTPAKPGEIGELVVVPEDGRKPEGLFMCYLDNDELYEEVWRGGVYHTGDSAYIDEDGALRFNGRFDDIIKTGGYRVGPYEVENVLMEHPAVLECSVIGVPDRLRGQAIKAIIVLREGCEAGRQLEKEIKDFTNSRLSDYKWIRLIEFVPEMPKTISGKIRKSEQRSEASEK